MLERYVIPGFSRYALVLEDDEMWAVIGVKGKPIGGTCKPDGRRMFGLIGDNGRKVSLQLARVILYALTELPPHHTRWACHRDGNPTNNHPDNLYWGTPRDNILDTLWHEIEPGSARHRE